MRDTDDGAEILDTADLPAQDLLRVIEMRQLAFASWWAPGHPGWGIIDELESPSSKGATPVRQTSTIRQTSTMPEIYLGGVFGDVHPNPYPSLPPEGLILAPCFVLTVRVGG